MKKKGFWTGWCSLVLWRSRVDPIFFGYVDKYLGVYFYINIQYLVKFKCVVVERCNKESEFIGMKVRRVVERMKEEYLRMVVWCKEV
jgi:hypothetical protein